MRATIFAAPHPRSPSFIQHNDRLQLHFNFNCCSLCDAAAAAAAAGNVCVCCGQLQQGGIKTTTNRKTERETDAGVDVAARYCCVILFFFGCWCDQILYLHSH